MKRYVNLRVSLAALAAIVGAGFASGREIMTFFTGMGWASWIGIVCACVAVGLLTAMLARFQLRSGARNLPAVFGAEMGKPCEDAVHGLYGLLMLLTASVMIAAGGELGQLALPLHSAAYVGMALTIIASMVTAFYKGNGLAMLGALLAPAIVVFYVCLAADGRPAPVTFPDRTAAVVGSVPLTIIMGVLYAALNVTMAGGAVLIHCDRGVSPRRVGYMTGGMLFLMLAAANAAFLLAGPGIRNLAMPSVVLAARFGSAGYYISIAVLWCAVVTTLTAAFQSLHAQAVSLGLRPLTAMALIVALALLFALIGFAPLVDIGYPLLGWSCALALLALIAFI